MWQSRDPEWDKLNSLGEALSIRLKCPVRYPAYDKRAFECQCGITFPVFMVEGGDWDTIMKKHRREII